MKFLIDHNLSPKLAKHLSAWFPGSLHTEELGFGRTSDNDLWQYALENGFSILTKDTDYEHISLLRGSPPKVVWLRIGNAPTSKVMEVLGKNHEAILQFLHDDERSLLALSE